MNDDISKKLLFTSNFVNEIPNTLNSMTYLFNFSE